jgi:hypothetical protein
MIQVIFQRTSVQKGINFEDVKSDMKALVSEQLEKRFNGISESSEKLLFPCS